MQNVSIDSSSNVTPIRVAPQDQETHTLANNMAHVATRNCISTCLELGVAGVIDDWLESNLRWGADLAIKAYKEENYTKREWMKAIGEFTILVCSRYSAVSALSERQMDALAPCIMKMLYDCYAECCLRKLSTQTNHYFN